MVFLLCEEDDVVRPPCARESCSNPKIQVCLRPPQINQSEDGRLRGDSARVRLRVAVGQPHPLSLSLSFSLAMSAQFDGPPPQPASAPDVTALGSPSSSSASGIKAVPGTFNLEGAWNLQETLAPHRRSARSELLELISIADFASR
jgi:hypothetical protein